MRYVSRVKATHLRSARSCCSTIKTVHPGTASRSPEDPISVAKQRLSHRPPLGLERIGHSRVCQPRTTSASFHPRCHASWIPVFIPFAPTGLWMCPASPAKKIRPFR